jgi:hypothetical protein
LPVTGKGVPAEWPSDDFEEEDLRRGFALAFCMATENVESAPPGWAVFALVAGSAAGAVMAGGPEGDRTSGEAFIPLE